MPNSQGTAVPPSPHLAPSPPPSQEPPVRRGVDACVVGLGYVGLPLALVMARAGLRVHGYDVRLQVIEAVQQSRLPYFEAEGLERALQQVVAEERLSAGSTPVHASTFLICVPTPVNAEQRPDISLVEAACEAIAPHLAAGNLVIIESTCPVRTTERLRDQFRALRPDLSFDEAAETAVSLAYCPERVLPGNTLHELVHNNRVVGGLSPRATQRAATFYRRFVRGQVAETTARTAEMCKLAENTFRDINIAFANELANLSTEVDVDPFELIRLANLHPRVRILQPGPGVGGHCIAVDPWFLVDVNPASARLTRTAREINDSQPARVAGRILAAAQALSSPVVACLGLSYKADVDDLRDSPAAHVVLQLAQHGLDPLWVVEPHIEQLPPSLAHTGVQLVSLERALQAADVLVLLVDHLAFRAIDPALLANRTLVDTRGIW